MRLKNLSRLAWGVDDVTVNLAGVLRPSVLGGEVRRQKRTLVSRSNTDDSRKVDHINTLVQKYFGEDFLKGSIDR